MNIVKLHDCLRTKDNLKITGYPDPVVESILNFHIKTIYARVIYGKQKFRVLCLMKSFRFEFSVLSLLKDEETDYELLNKLKNLLESVVSSHNKAVRNMV